MVGPLAVFGVVALASLVVGTGGYVFRHDIASILTKRPIAVLGQRGVGKTVLLTFLTTGSVMTEYTPTRASVPMGRGKFAGKNSNADNLYFAKSVDVSGDDASTVAWQAMFARAANHERGICLYLVNAQKLLSEDPKHLERLRLDMDRIAEWSREYPSKLTPRIAIIATHIDKVDDWVNGSASQRAAIEDIVRRHELFHPVVQDSQRFLDVICSDLSTVKGISVALDDLCGVLTAKESP